MSSDWVHGEAIAINAAGSHRRRGHRDTKWQCERGNRDRGQTAEHRAAALGEQDRPAPAVPPPSRRVPGRNVATQGMTLPPQNTWRRRANTFGFRIQLRAGAPSVPDRVCRWPRRRSGPARKSLLRCPSRPETGKATIVALGQGQHGHAGPQARRPRCLANSLALARCGVASKSTADNRPACCSGQKHRLRPGPCGMNGRPARRSGTGGQHDQPGDLCDSHGRAVARQKTHGDSAPAIRTLVHRERVPAARASSRRCSAGLAGRCRTGTRPGVRRQCGRCGQTERQPEQVPVEVEAGRQHHGRPCSAPATTSGR